MQNQKTDQRQLEPKTSHGLPDKLYFSIGEVARFCDVKPHVLRYWEQVFPQIALIRRRGNRRYYRHRDVLLVLKIKSLLYDQGFTVQGARVQLSSQACAQLDQTPEWRLSVISELENVLAELEL